MTAHVQEPVPPIRGLAPDVPDELATVLDRMLAKEPDARYATPGEVAEALAPFSTDCDLPGLLVRAEEAEAVAAEPPSPGTLWVLPRQPALGAAETPPTPLPFRRRGRLLAAAIGLMLLSLGGGIALGIIITIHRNGQTTSVELPDGSSAKLDKAGNLSVTPPGEAGKPTPLPAKADLTIKPLDVVNIVALGTLADCPIDGLFLVEPDGQIALGRAYGRVQVKGLLFEQAQDKIEQHLRAVVIDPTVQITSAGKATGWQWGSVPKAPYRIRPHHLLYIHVHGVFPDAPIGGTYVVEPNGKVPLGVRYGRVQLEGLTLEEAEHAVEKHLSDSFVQPVASVTLAGWTTQDRLKTPAGAQATAAELVEIQVNKDGTLRLAGRQVSVDASAPWLAELRQRVAGGAGVRVEVRCDPEAAYRHVAALTEALQAAGVNDVSIRLAEPPVLAAREEEKEAATAPAGILDSSRN